MKLPTPLYPFWDTGGDRLLIAISWALLTSFSGGLKQLICSYKKLMPFAWSTDKWHQLLLRTIINGTGYSRKKKEQVRIWLPTTCHSQLHPPTQKKKQNAEVKGFLPLNGYK